MMNGKTTLSLYSATYNAQRHHNNNISCYATSTNTSTPMARVFTAICGRYLQTAPLFFFPYLVQLSFFTIFFICLFPSFFTFLEFLQFSFIDLNFYFADVSHRDFS